MVKSVTAWEADDGKVFPTEAEAVKHDARIKLVDLKLFNEGTTQALLTNPHEVAMILSDLARALPRTAESTSDAKL